MLIQLTQRPPGGAGQGNPVLVGSDHIIRGEGAAGGSTLLLTTGAKVEVLEHLDEIMDLQDGAHDAPARKAAAEKRKTLREQRRLDQQRREADAAAEKHRREAIAAQAEADKLRRAADGSAAAARAAMERAGMTKSTDVTPEGIDLKHPAPQPHQPAPVGTAAPGDPTAQPAIGSPDYEASRKAEAEKAGTQPGGTPHQGKAEPPRKGGNKDRV